MPSTDIEVRRETNRRFYKNHRDEMRERNREYYKAHKERYISQAKEWAEKNSQKRKDIQSAYRERVKSRIKITRPEKLCNKCGNVLPANMFYTDNSSVDGLQRHCIECQTKYRRSRSIEAVDRTREWNKNHPDERKSHNLKRYGIDINDYRAMLDAQNGKCAICGTKDTGNGSYFCVDHDHETGKVRGLLCTLCNGGIGFFKDNPIVMGAAIEYVLRHKESPRLIERVEQEEGGDS